MISIKKAYRDERRKNLVNSNLITVLSVPMYLVTAADFKQYVARGQMLRKLGKEGKNDEFCPKTRISHPWWTSLYLRLKKDCEYWNPFFMLAQIRKEPVVKRRASRKELKRVSYTLQVAALPCCVTNGLIQINIENLGDWRIYKLLHYYQNHYSSTPKS